METAKLLFNHILYNYGIPEDIVSEMPPIRLICLEGLLQTPGCDGQPLVWVSSTEQQADRTEDIGDLN